LDVWAAEAPSETFRSLRPGPVGPAKLWILTGEPLREPSAS
jgi:hypothetical protein